MPRRFAPAHGSSDRREDTGYQMPDQHCEAVRRWLRQDDRAALAAPPPSELAEHGVSCPICRGTLAAAVADLLRPVAPGGGLTCAACQDQLDIYIACERRHGATVAAQRYSDIWWHLWTCEECAEVYELTNTLLDAEREHMLAPIQSAVAPARRARLPRLQLPRAFLHGVFAPHAALGGAWSGGDEESLFAEEELEGYRIALGVRQRGAVHWGIGILVTPPLAGWAVISFGELRFRTPFDQHGQAVVPEIPLELLTDRAGPDMLITIEPRDTGA